MTTVHDFSPQSIDGKEQPLSAYAGKVLLIVNVASRCGLTPHYAGLEKLQQKYEQKGFSVLGFPCNDFGAQEPGTEEEIKTFCESKYDVTFPLFAKVKVLGEGKHPLYAHLTTQESAPDGPGDITWNFSKFVIGKKGEVVARFDPRTTPEDPKLISAIEGALG